MINDKIKSPKTTSLNYGFTFNENVGVRVKGDVKIEFINGEERELVLEKTNIYTLDGGVLAGMLFSGVSRPINMLAVGIGAGGLSNSPDIADNRQRRINSELERKTFSSVVYRDTLGAVSSVPTNVVDFTTVFENTEAVGALTEMGLLSTVDANPVNTTPLQDVNGLVVFPNRDTTLDLGNFDVLVNYLTFPVINKPSGSVLAITWRLTF